jgi:hypothetical protein
MKATLSAAFIFLAAGAHAQTQATPPPAKGLNDQSENAQCWDVLQNVARDKAQHEGKLQATGEYAKQHSASSEERKVQGPGAEPKDPTGVTVGESNAGQKRFESGASIRPPGLPNC